MHEADRQRLLADVEAFCQALREHEELAYVEHHYNDKLIPLAKQHNILGMPVPVQYGGRGTVPTANLAVASAIAFSKAWRLSSAADCRLAQAPI